MNTTVTPDVSGAKFRTTGKMFVLPAPEYGDLKFRKMSIPRQPERVSSSLATRAYLGFGENGSPE